VLIPHRDDLEREKGSAARYLRGKAQLNLHPFCCSCKEDKTSLFRFYYYYYYWKKQRLGTWGVQGCGGELQVQEDNEHLKKKKKKGKFNCINTTEEKLGGVHSCSGEKGETAQQGQLWKAQDQLKQHPAKHTHKHGVLGALLFISLEKSEFPFHSAFKDSQFLSLSNS